MPSAPARAALNAFPLTPLRDDRLDEAALVRIVERLAAAGVDAITVLGSTGSGAYLDRAERARVVRLAVDAAGDVPVHAGVSALRTAHALAFAEDAAAAGARGLLLAPQSYQPLTDDDVAHLYADVTAATELPVVVYDNPGTTRFTFSTALYGRVAALPGVVSLKIPGVPADPWAAAERVAEIRTAVPTHVGVGVSGDAFGAAGLIAGCDTWYSVIAGTLPEPAVRITRAVREGRPADALTESERLAPLWDLFARHGSLRVTAAAAEHLGHAAPGCLPRPLLGLGPADRAEVAGVVDRVLDGEPATRP
ncbi:dihydrodipicolinate synthase family protein [Micrococcus flavus]|uniref:4-hydroxy-tetrahydrodipicolinate synthase n=1 Tax=Micrococcus flavus TaxID=384602 RepID=A0A4Y8WZL1_9MICC|nr:dihydrodipicolinate synthase family protein [Micrococcus flavus]MBB4881766.1 4-hydroxy-tetrahydrodipicolinate synthase [Micrococcus flavus]TFI01045.1 dihydrodipicolinate synthase family protein [Micrococcus flavus]GGK53320.1 dihydrodipicolinate synthase family protein [Micrococcus flavus]